MASYVLLTLGGSKDQVRSGMTYVVVSLTASALFVTAVGLRLRRHRHGQHGRPRGEARRDPADGVRTALGLMLLVVFGVKAAIFPLYFWLPDSYPTAPAPVTAVFAGLLTKVGVYAIIRTQTLLFPQDEHRTRCCWCSALPDDGRRHPRGAGAGGGEADPVASRSSATSAT